MNSNRSWLTLRDQLVNELYGRTRDDLGGASSATAFIAVLNGALGVGHGALTEPTGTNVWLTVQAEVLP